MTKVYIYGLTFNNVIRYVGKSENLEKRIKDHFFEAYNSKNKSYNLPKSRWIRKHIDIKYVILEECTKDNWAEREIFWISNLPNLLNLSKGGDGGSKPIMSEATKIKISEKAKNRFVSKETREKMSKSHKKRNYDYVDNKGIKNPRATPVYQYDSDGNFIRKWDYQKEAIAYYNMNKTAITDCIKGRQKTAKGFIWKRQKLN